MFLSVTLLILSNIHLAIVSILKQIPMLSFIIKLLKNKYVAIIYTLIIFILCTLPSKELPKDVNDKTAHFVAFAGFSFFWLWVKENYKIVVFVGVIYGICIEFWQAILPESFHRGFDWFDALADGIGVLIGYFIYLLSKFIVGRFVEKQ